MEETTQVQEEITTSSLFNKKDAKKTFTKIGLALLAFLGLMIILFKILCSAIPDLYIFFTSLDTNIEIVIKYGILYGIGFLLFFLVIRKAPKDIIPKEKFKFGRLIVIFFMTYPLAIAGNLIGGAVENLLSPGNVTAMNIMDFASNGSVLSVVVMVIVAPFVEEMVFRKMIIDRTKRFGEKTAILFSALCFGFYHMTISQFLYATCIGCIFGYVYSRSGKIHYTMIMHATINAISCVLALSLSKFSELSDVVGNVNTGSVAMVDPQALMEAITPAHVIAMLVMLLLFLLIIVMIILGIIFLCTRARKVRFVETSPYCIPKGQRFKTIASSWGFILFVVVCVAVVVLNIM